MKNNILPLKPSIFLFLLACPVLGLAAGYLTSAPGEQQAPPDDDLVEYALLSQKRATNWAVQKTDKKPLSPTERDKKKRLNALLAKLLKGDLPSDWNATLKQIVELTSSVDERNDAFCLTLSLWAKTDFEAAMNMANKSGFHARSIKTILLNQFANEDHVSALKYYEEHREDLIHYNTFPLSIVKNWAKHSPGKALEWCLSAKNADQDKRYGAFYACTAKQDNPLLAAFMEGVLTESPDLVVDYLSKIQEAKGNIPYSFLDYWTQTNPDEAIKWYESAKAPNQNLLPALVNGIAKNNLKRAEDFIEKQPQAQQDELYRYISEIRQNTQGEEAALNWALTKITPDSSPFYYMMPLVSWASSDHEAARLWVEKLPSGALKDEAIGDYARMTLSNPKLTDKSLEFIDTITNEKLKQEKLEQAVKSWKKIYPEEFKQWMDDTTKPERLQSMVKKALTP